MISPQSGPVAVTGATGFIGSYVIQELLARGHQVRACVRDPNDSKKLAHLEALRTGRPGTLTFVRGDLLEQGSYDAAFDGAAGVIHTAAVVLLAARDAEKTIVEPSLLGTRNVLDAIEKAGSVRRLVHTSSVVAMVSRPEPGRIYTEADWSDEATLKSDPYAYAKREAERMVAAFPHTSVVRINPTLVFGPVMTRVHSKASPAIVWDMLAGTYPAYPRFSFSTVDVREVARAHVEALERPAASGRYLVSSEHAWFADMAKILAEAMPDLKIRTGQMPDFMMYLVALVEKRLSFAMLKNLLGRPQQVDASRSTAELGISYRSLRDSLVDTARSMIDQGFVKPKKKS